MSDSHIVTISEPADGLSKLRQSEDYRGSITVNERLTYCWQNITVHVPEARPFYTKFRKPYQLKCLIDNGFASPGEVTVLMGISGSGKSTFLNVLNFKNSRFFTVSGKRTLNGFIADRETMANVSAYVQQQDLFLGNLTVGEHLNFYLMSNPLLFFCDEPTSGLDSFMAQNVVQTLKLLASQGRTVVTTIHQPSSEVFAMFDKIILLNEGQLVFTGTIKKALDFFRDLGKPCPTNYNPADFFMFIIASPDSESSSNVVASGVEKFAKTGLKDIERHIEEINRKPIPTKAIENARTVGRRVSALRQFYGLLIRAGIESSRNFHVVWTRLILMIGVAILIGGSYYNQKYDQDGVFSMNGAIFICLIESCMSNAYGSLIAFLDEQEVFLRDSGNGLYLTVLYFLAKSLTEIPISVIQPTIFVSITYHMINLNSQKNKFLIHWVIMMVASTVSSSFGFMVSTVSPSFAIALAIAPPVLLTMMLYSGFLMSIKTMLFYLEWLRYISWFYYSLEALIVNQWDGIIELECTRVAANCPPDGDTIIATYGFNKDNLWTDVLILVFIALIFKTGCFLGLYIRAKLDS